MYIIVLKLYSSYFVGIVSFIFTLCHLYLFQISIVRSHKINCLIFLRTITTNDFSWSRTRYQYAQVHKEKATKIVNKWTLNHLHDLESLMESVYCLSIGGIFYLVISNKVLSQIKNHNHNFGCPCFWSKNFNVILSYIFQLQCFGVRIVLVS